MRPPSRAPGEGFRLLRCLPGTERLVPLRLARCNRSARRDRWLFGPFSTGKPIHGPQNTPWKKKKSSVLSPILLTRKLIPVPPATLGFHVFVVPRFSRSRFRGSGLEKLWLQGFCLPPAFPGERLRLPGKVPWMIADFCLAVSTPWILVRNPCPLANCFYWGGVLGGAV